MSATNATVPPLTRFWLALERLPGLATTATYWQHLLRDDFARVSRLMVPDAQLATSVPRVDRWGWYFTVVDHGPVDIVGICEEDGERTILSRADLVIYRVAPSRLIGAVAGAFGFEMEGTPVADLTGTFRVGTFRPHPGLAVPVFLTIQLEHRDYKAVADALLAGTPGVFVLLAPTNRHHRIPSQLLFETRSCLFLALADAIQFNTPQWEMTDAARDALNTFTVPLTPSAKPPFDAEPLCERAQVILIAMLELDAIDSDRRQSTAKIAERAFGRDADANSLKPVVTDLADIRLIDTKGGRGGGCWLTEEGVRRAEKLQKVQDENG